MLQQLKRPIAKVYGKVRSRADGFIGPVKNSASKLLALFPNIKRSEEHTSELQSR